MMSLQMNYDAIDAGAKQVVEYQFRKAGNLAEDEGLIHTRS